jgi:hypothetical protein
MKPLVLMVLCFCLLSCNPYKRYRGGDYSFYDKRPAAGASALLRTDGVYVSDNANSNTGDKSRRPATPKKIYKFYPTGQVNMILDIDGRLTNADDYVEAFNQAIKTNMARPAATLFEGYYRLQGNKLVLEQVVTPIQQFTYTYAALQPDGIAVYAVTHEGKGNLKDKYYKNGYTAFYKFIPVKGGFITPDW